MTKQSILKFLQDDSGIQQLQEQLLKNGESSSYGLYEGQRMLATAAILENHKEFHGVVLCDTQKRAKELWEDLSQLLPETQVLYFPALEMIPYEVLAQSGEVEQKRLEVLTHLLQDGQTQQMVVVTTIESLSKKLLPVELFQQGCQTIAVGQILEPTDLRKNLIQFLHTRRKSKV